MTEVLISGWADGSLGGSEVEKGSRLGALVAFRETASVLIVVCVVDLRLEVFSGVDVTVVLFVTLRLDEDVVAGSVEITVLDSDVDVVDRVVVVFVLANLMSVSSSFI